MELGLTGRVAIVTGASRGLGRASAEALAAEGARLLISSRSEEAIGKTAGEIAASGAEVEAEPADMADPATAARLVARALERFGRVDVVVANAGGPPPGRALDVDDELLRRALEQNFLASARLAREAIPAMRERGFGRICCITSYSIVQPLPGLALSNAARTALWAWAKTAAADLAAEGSGITLNLVCPGPHATERMRELGGAGGAGPMGDPADFGKVVAFLCSEPAAFINGAALVVDGGASLAL
jgi:3-oxoacyl-[acyl-carrier protein] reductase